MRIQTEFDLDDLVYAIDDDKVISRLAVVGINAYVKPIKDRMRENVTQSVCVEYELEHQKGAFQEGQVFRTKTELIRALFHG